jgi:hypothetical protein
MHLLHIHKQDLKMIFIDWISTPDHRNFNRSFFTALQLKSATCLVFSERLIIPEVKCLLMTPVNGRLRHALRILRYIWENRKKPVILLSYDPLFAPFASIFKKDILVFEHNTTPQNGLSKHLVWQKLFFGRVRRMAQFPAQYARLLKIGNNATYIGSPILPMKISAQKKRAPSTPYMFLAPSYRANILELERYSELLNGAMILTKKSVGVTSTEVHSVSNLAIQYMDRVEFCHDGRMVDAVIITVQSRVRGTGWFNDSISNQTPIVIIDPDTEALFMETFPGYPFISLGGIENPVQFEQLLEQVRRFDSMTYAKSHNALIRARFFDMCDELSIRVEC